LSTLAWRTAPRLNSFTMASRMTAPINETISEAKLNEP
jgi:hypothetical protein